jgi:glycosyltransferase involved in cell wall biosynthesis
MSKAINIKKKLISKAGLRSKGYFKKSYNNKPLISVITVVLNGKKYLEETIKSVLNQTYDNIEYVIIDGGSTDGTIDIIKKYEDKIDYWVSEPDNGIYDAMNKAIDAITGKWVNFINSSDTLNDNAYSKIIDFLVKSSNTCDVIAFGHSIKNVENHLLKTDYKPSLIKKWKMPSSHNSIIYKSNVLKNYKFNLSFKYACDFEQINKIKDKKTICKNDFILLTGRNDGFIANNKFQSIFEYVQICWKNANKIFAFYWLLRLILEFILLRIRKIRRKV